MKKNLFLIVSVILNLLLVVIISIYMFSPLLDMIIIQKSLPRFCAFVEKNDPTAYKNVTLCHIAEQPVSQTQPIIPTPVAQKSTTNQPVANQPTPITPVTTQNNIEVKELGFKIPIDISFAGYAMEEGAARFYSKANRCDGGGISKILGTPSDPKGQDSAPAEFYKAHISQTKQFDGFFLYYQNPQAVSCDPKKYADEQQKILKVVEDGLKDATPITK